MPIIAKIETIKVPPILKLFYKTFQNFQKTFNVGDIITVNETKEPVRGHFGLIQ